MLGNAVTLPLISLAVMPAAVIGVLAFPFGLDRPVWTLMGWAVAAVLDLSRWVAGMAGSVVIVPAFGLGTLGLFVAALLCATLFASALRWLALAPALLAFWAAAHTPRPDIYLARDGSGAAIRGRDGRLVIAGRVSAFTAEQWLRADGDARKGAEAAAGQAGSERARCDRMGCVVPMQDDVIASFVEDRRGFAEDCRRATIILSRLAAPPGCAASLVLDRGSLAERGALAIRFGPSRPVIEGTRRAHETRPWLVRGETNRSPAARQPVTSAQRSLPPPDLNEPARDPLDEAPDVPSDAQ
jgi:competence protein ComEC